MDLTTLKRIVVKVGSTSMVDTRQEKIRQQWLDSLTEDIAWLINKHKMQVIAMSSGALVWGFKELDQIKGTIGKNLKKRIAGAIGQIGISNAWEAAFKKWNLVTGQMLLTLEDTKNVEAQNTIKSMLEKNIVPLINENIPLLAKYDNDQLAVRIAKIIRAEALIFLTDVEGLYSGDPRRIPNATLISEVRNITTELREITGGSSSGTGTGGMATKINAAEIASGFGCHCAIASGEKLHPLKSISNGTKCTWFIAKQPKNEE